MKHKILKRIGIFLLGIVFLSGELICQIIELPYNYYQQGINDSYRLFNKELLKKSKEILEKYEINKLNFWDDGLSEILSAKQYYYDNNFFTADKTLERFINQNPNSPFKALAGVYRAYFAISTENFVDAEKYFLTAKKISEGEFQLRSDSVYVQYAHISTYWAGISMAKQGKYIEAQQQLEECIRKYQGMQFTDDAFFAMGYISDINQNYEIALTFYRTMVRNYPYSNVLIAAKIKIINNLLILKDISGALIEIENTETTIRSIQSKDLTGVKYEPQDYFESINEELLYLKGEAYTIGGRYDYAISTLSEFLEKYPKSGLLNNAKNAIAWAYLNSGEFTKAEDYYNQVINSIVNEQDLLKSSARLFRATIYKRSGDKERALKEFMNLATIADFPYTSNALLEIGQIYYENEDYEKASKFLERAERDATDAGVLVRIHLLLGATYLEMKKYTKAATEYRLANQLVVKSSPLFMPLKNWYLGEARLKEAIAQIRNSKNNEAIPLLLAYLGDNTTHGKTDEAIFWLAEAYYRSDLLKNAEEKYKSLVDNYPDSKFREEALYGLGWSYFRQKEFNKSSQAFERMLTEFPKTKHGVEVLTRQGDGYYYIRNFRKAAESYRKAANLAPDTDEGQYSAYQLCQALYRLGNLEDAITSLLSFVRKYPRSDYAVHALYLTGWIRFQQKSYSESIEDFTFLIQAYPQSQLVPRAYFAIGDAYYNMENFELALINYEKIVDLYPSSNLAAEAIKSMQYCYVSLGKDDEALRIADKYVESNPTSPFAPDFVFKKGEMFYEGKKFKDAAIEYENFINKYPDNNKNDEALYWMGKSYLNLDDADKAELTFKKLVDKHPNSEYAPLGLLEMGLIKKQKADLKSSDSLLRQLQIKYPDHEAASQAGYERASIKYSTGDTSAALRIFWETFNKYKTLEYGNQSLYRIAMHYRMARNSDSAKYYFKSLSDRVEYPSLAAESHFRLGEIAMRDANYNDAAMHFIAVKDGFAGFEDWYTLSILNLGECYERLNDYPKARELYKMLEALRPDDEYGKTAKRRLKSIEKM